MTRDFDEKTFVQKGFFFQFYLLDFYACADLSKY